MTDTAHTQGPWSLSKPSGIYIDAPTGCIAALTYGATKADAHLIAAAPDLLAALVNCLDLIEDEGLDELHGDLAEVVRDAINKAKGN